MSLQNLKRACVSVPILLNGVLFTGSFLGFAGSTFYPDLVFFERTQVFFGTLLFFASGFLFTALIEQLVKRKFDLYENISFSFLGIVIFFPLLLEVEFLLFGLAYSWFPLFNVALLLLIVFLVRFFFGSTAARLRPVPRFSMERFLASPFPFFLLFIVFVLIIVLAYPALPDLDPYKWLFKYSYQFPNQQLDILERPLFGAFTFIGVKLVGISLLTFYKYFFPFLISFIVFPAWLCARFITVPAQRLLFMFFLFTSPVILLYGTTAMPQTPIIILSYYFLFFSLYSYLKKDLFFFYAGGLSALAGYLFHPAIAIIFLCFVIGCLFHWRTRLLKDKKILFLLLLLAATNYERIRSATGFVTNWTNIIVNRFFLPNRLNLAFPTSYLNIDNTVMGWPGLDGVIKYYAFHVGPVVVFTIGVFLWLMIQQKFRKDFFSDFKDMRLWVLLLCFLPFFAISEILPRFPNLALLPDRSWIFGGIFSLIFAFFSLYKTRLPKTLLLFGAFSVLITIGGAVYINNLKQYLITPTQLRSAKWIVQNLPPNRVFLSSGNKNLLPVYADSRLLKLPEELYCGDMRQFDSYFMQIEPDNFYNQQIENTPLELRADLDAILRKQNIDVAQTESVAQKKLILEESFQALVEQVQKDSGKLAQKPGLPLFTPPTGKVPALSKAVPIENIYRGEEFNYMLNPNDQLYIYYSKVDPRNPYENRPYTISTWGFDSCPNNTPFLFDRYPEKFQKIYDDHGQVIIWKIL